MSTMRNQHELTKEQKSIRKKIIEIIDNDKGFKEDLLSIIEPEKLITYITEAVKSYDKNISKINLIITDEQERYTDLFKITKEKNLMRIRSTPIYSFSFKADDYNRIRKGEQISSEIVGMVVQNCSKGIIKYPLFVYTQIQTLKIEKYENNILNIIIYSSKYNNKKFKDTLEDGFEIIERTLPISLGEENE